MSETSNKVGLLFNTQKPEALATAERLLAWGRNKGVRFLVPPHEASAISVPETPDNVWREEVAFAVILGGDGTFLRAARYTFGHNVPLYGINLGRLGFLATGNSDSAEQDIIDILDHKYVLQRRDLLKVLSGAAAGSCMN